jgi:hypothetical protein
MTLLDTIRQSEKRYHEKVKTPKTPTRKEGLENAATLKEIIRREADKAEVEKELIRLAEQEKAALAEQGQNEVLKPLEAEVVEEKAPELMDPQERLAALRARKITISPEQRDQIMADRRKLQRIGRGQRHKRKREAAA